MAGTPIQLETLMTTVLMDAKAFLEGQVAVLKASRELETSFAEMASKTAASMNSMRDSSLRAMAAMTLAAGEMSASVTASIGMIAPSATVLAGVESAAAAITANASSIAASAPQMGLLATSLKGMSDHSATLASHLSAINKDKDAIVAVSNALQGVSTSSQNISNITGAVDSFVLNIEKTAQSIEGLKGLSRPLTVLSNAFAKMDEAIAKLASSGAGLATVQGQLSSFGTGIKDLEGPSKYVKTLAKGLADLKDATVRIGYVGPRLDKLIEPFTNIAGPLASLAGAGESLTSLARGLTRLKAIKMGDITSIASAIGLLGPELSKLPPMTALAGAEASLTGVANGLRAFGQAPKTMEAGVKLIGTLGASLSTAAGGISALAGMTGALQGISQAITGITQAAPQMQAAATDLHGFVSKLATVQVAAMQPLSTALAGVANGVSRMAQASSALAGTQGGLLKFMEDLGSIAKGISQPMKDLGLAMSRIGRFLEAVSVTRFSRITKVLDPLKQFSEGFANFAATLATPSVNAASMALARVGTFLEAFQRLKKPTVAFDELKTNLGGLLDTIAAKGSLANIDKGANAINRMAGFLRGLEKADPAKLAPLSTGIGDLLSKMGAAPAAGAMESAKVLTRVNTAMKSMVAINPAAVVASAKAAASAMAILNNVPVSPNAMRMASVMSRVGLAMKNMGAGGGGAGWGFGGWGGGPGGPGGLGNLAGGFRGIPSAANAATASTRNFGQAVKALFLASDAGFVGLQRIQTTMAGLGVLGVVQFARMNDELVKVQAHMEDWEGRFRPELQRALFDVSSRSVTGMQDLAKGLDILVSSGMSAAMAVRALSTAENFAVASGMNMQKATRRLVDVMNAVDWTVHVDPGDAEALNKHLGNMTRMADIFIGMAPKVGSTAEQMSEVFNVRLTSAMVSTKTSFEDAVAMAAIYSKIGEPGRGSTAGTRIGRGLEAIMTRTTTHAAQWDQMFQGAHLDKATGKLKPMIELLQEMGKKLGDLNQRRAQMITLGFEQDAIAALAPLLDHYENLRELRDMIEETGDLSAKTAALMRTGLLSQMRIMFNAASTLAAAFGERLAPALVFVTEGFVNLSRAFYAMNPAFQNLIAGAAVIWAAWWPVKILLLSISSALIGLVVNILLLPLLPFRMIASAVSFLWGVVSGAAMAIAGLAMTMWTVLTFPIAAINSLIAAVHSVWDWLKALGSSIGSFFNGVWSVLKSIGSAIGFVFNVIGEGISTILVGGFLALKTMGSVIGSMISMMGGLAASIVTVVASFAVGIVLMTVLLPLVAVALGMLTTALVGAVALAGTVGFTLVASIGPLITLIGTGLVAAWNAFRSSAQNALRVAGQGVVALHEAAGGLWQRMREGAAGMTERLVANLAVIAGFFWNIRQNMEVIWKWMGKYGVRAFDDVGRAAFNVIERIADTMWRTFMGIASAIGEALSAAWNSLAAGAGKAFFWIRLNWDLLMANLGMALSQFGSNFVKNFVFVFRIIHNIIDDLLQDMFERILYATTNIYSEETQGKNIKTHQQYRAAQLANLLAGKEALNPKNTMVPPLAGMSDLDWIPFMTQRVDPTKDTFPATKIKMWDEIKGAMAEEWSSVGESMARGFSAAFIGMQPFRKAFDHITKSPIWAELGEKLNLVLPPDAAEKSLEFFKKVFFPSTGEGGMADPLMKGNVGFTAKQISLERTMVGGETANTLDFQQLITLKAIDTKLGVIIQAGGGKVGRPAVKE